MAGAKVVNNSPICPFCDEKEKLKVIDVDTQSTEDDTYFSILIICRNCNKESFYYLDLFMENRYSITDKRLSKITKENEVND